MRCCCSLLPLPEAAATLALDVTDPERAVRDMAAALGIATAAALTFTPTPYIYIAQTLYTGTGLFALIAIPGFILAGELMVRSKLTDQIIRVMFVLAGNIKGGLAVCTFLSCAFFAALSGSGPATAASGAPGAPPVWACIT